MGESNIYCKNKEERQDYFPSQWLCSKQAHLNERNTFEVSVASNKLITYICGIYNPTNLTSKYKIGQICNANKLLKIIFCAIGVIAIILIVFGVVYYILYTTKVNT
jgi:hypothetical protein